MARSSFLSSTRRRGSISFVSIMIYAAGWKNDVAMCGESVEGGKRSTISGCGPSRVAAGFAERVFHIGDSLLDLFDFFLLCRDLGVFLVDVLASVLFREGLLWIRVILELGFVIFAL